MPTSTPRLSAYNKAVLAIGGPIAVIAGLTYAWYANQALWPTETFTPNRRPRQVFWDIINGVDVRDPQALQVAQISLLVAIVAGVVTVGLVIVGAIRKESSEAKLELNVQDMPFWQVGDRLGWRADDGVHTGVITETHRRPFAFEGELIKAFAGGPGLVIRDDATGELVGRSFGSSFRIKGTSGPSGTLESIRPAMNAAVEVGDEFAWIDLQGEPAEGEVVEIHHRAFAVGGTRVSASADRPGYTVRRADGTLLGIGSDLREKA